MNKHIEAAVSAIENPTPDLRFWVDVAVLLVMSLALLAIGAGTLRRRTP